MFSKDEVTWIRNQVNGQYSKSKVNDSIDALDAFLTTKEVLTERDEQPFGKLILAFQKYNDQEKKERIKDIDIENFAKGVFKLVEPDILESRPQNSKFTSWTLAPILVEILQIFDNYNLRSLSERLDGFTDSLDDKSQLQNHYLRIYKYRNSNIHEGNELYPTLSPLDVTQLFISLLCVLLDICYKYRDRIYSEYKKKGRSYDLNPKNYLKSIKEKYETQTVYKYVNVRWHCEYDKTTIGDIDSVNQNIDELINNNILYRTKFLGEAGTGKTTALKRIEYEMAKKWKRNNAIKLPVYIALSDFAEINNYSIIDCIAERMEIDDNTNTQGYLEDGELCILLDGYNEILDADKKRAVAKEVDALAFHYNECQFVISSRSGKEMIPILNNAKCLYLTELTLEDKMQFFQNSVGSQEILDIINEKMKVNPEYFQRFSTPIQLFFLATIIENEKSFPNAEDLVEQYLKLLFKREQNEKKEYNMEYLPDYLRAIAIKMSNENQGMNENQGLSEYTVTRVMAKIKEGLGYSMSDTVQCLKLAIELGVLVKNGLNISFASEEYYEYFFFDGINYFDEDDELIRSL